MTDNEIIVPLKCLVMNESDCRHCKLKDKNDKCQKFLYSDVLGLIDENNRQKAEIERYLHSIKLLEKDVAEAKTEAVKGFAEIVKANLDDFYYTREDGLLETGQLIDTLVNIWLQETKKEGTEK